MARVSRKRGIEKAEGFKEAGIYHTGIYLRLSVEDNGKKDADSMENQKNLLMEYVSARPYLMLTDIYMDNGFTGTDFERPEFNRMLQDARNGRINCIVVKDLSRLGRNYVEAGDYIEKVFPFLGIRFIAVNDHYDSDSLTSGDELGASLKNVVNDVYTKDISRKVGTAMKQKRLRGEYIGNYAPYGYLKDPQDKNHLIIDQEIAPIVVEIFELRARGNGINTIARILNERDIPSPGRLRYERGIITNNNKKGSGLLWSRHVLSDLLKNVVYIGNLAQGRSASCLYKGIPFHWTEESEWDLVENTHEAIISPELWKRVQEVTARKSREAKESHGKYADLPKRENPYGSLLRCADCGRVIKQVHAYNTSKRNGTSVYYNYKCPENIELGDMACPKKNIRAADLDEAVLATIRKQMEIFMDTQKILKELIAQEKETAKQEAPIARVKDIQKEIDRRKGLCTALYTDLKEGILTQDEYFYAKMRYQEEIDSLEKELQELKSIRGKASEVVQGEKKWEQLISKYYKAQTLNTAMMEAIVKEIKLYADNSISIEFRYMNEFEELLQECERIRREVA
ncbi:recombinase family protein [uncultured Acetatifactor sp.]|jgi:site-specific DNA recombinase|uniref:recombinase family protein n=1 Tax=uncultured Acetatifactor sp. TaxID=1671927 RepID=UPI002606D842|nr:recombinase family protein [uncultured Acetatifactor sp.]